MLYLPFLKNNTVNGCENNVNKINSFPNIENNVNNELFKQQFFLITLFTYTTITTKLFIILQT